MDDLLKEYVISFFDKHLQFHGDRPEAVRWTKEGQYMHYKSLLDIGNISGKKILDFGCGKGDFYQFLRHKGIEVIYYGYDINEKLISLAQKKFPEADFRVFDIDRQDLKENFDFIFLCGVFNLKVPDLDKTIKYTIKKLFSHCDIALAFNALSIHNPKKDFELHYVSPEEIFQFSVKELSPFVSIRHDRMLYDFTIFVYKDMNKV